MMTMTEQSNTLPAVEMFDSHAAATLAGLHVSKLFGNSRDELVNHVISQAYQSAGFGPVLAVLNSYAN